MSTEFFSAAVLLLLVIDPFGNVPVVISALQNVAPGRRTRVILRECVVAYVVLVAFMLGGRTFMQWLQLTETSLAIAGGIAHRGDGGRNGRDARGASPAGVAGRARHDGGGAPDGTVADGDRRPDAARRRADVRRGNPAVVTL
jgi:hypothetical protein